MRLLAFLLVAATTASAQDPQPKTARDIPPGTEVIEDIVFELDAPPPAEAPGRPPPPPIHDEAVVDERPELIGSLDSLQRRLPLTPEQRARVTGTVFSFSLVVGADGRILEARPVADAALTREEFTELLPIRDAIWQSIFRNRFTPGRLNDEPVRVRTTLTFRVEGPRPE